MGYFDPLHGRVYLETPIWDRHDWPKLEPPDLARWMAVLPEMLERVARIETHLADGARTPFVRPAMRAPTSLQDPSEILRSLQTRLEAVEKTLGSKHEK